MKISSYHSPWYAEGALACSCFAQCHISGTCRCSLLIPELATANHNAAAEPCGSSTPVLATGAPPLKCSTLDCSPIHVTFTWRHVPLAFGLYVNVMHGLPASQTQPLLHMETACPQPDATGMLLLPQLPRRAGACCLPTAIRRPWHHKCLYTLRYCRHTPCRPTACWSGPPLCLLLGSCGCARSRRALPAFGGCAACCSTRLLLRLLQLRLHLLQPLLCLQQLLLAALQLYRGGSSSLLQLLEGATLLLLWGVERSGSVSGTACTACQRAVAHRGTQWHRQDMSRCVAHLAWTRLPARLQGCNMLGTTICCSDPEASPFIGRHTCLY